MMISAFTPARTIPSRHQSRNAPIVNSSLSVGISRVNSGVSGREASSSAAREANDRLLSVTCSKSVELVILLHSSTKPIRSVRY